MGTKLLLILAIMPAVAPAASFGLGAVLRVGGAFEVELQLGSTSASPVVASPFFPFWLDGLDDDRSRKRAFSAPSRAVHLLFAQTSAARRDLRGDPKVTMRIEADARGI